MSPWSYLLSPPQPLWLLAAHSDHHLLLFHLLLHLCFIPLQSLGGGEPELPLLRCFLCCLQPCCLQSFLPPACIHTLKHVPAWVLQGRTCSASPLLHVPLKFLAKPHISEVAPNGRVWSRHWWDWARGNRRPLPSPVSI